MRINSNLSAMNTYSKLTSANSAKSGSLEKLSSGLRINRAGDDAAGLAISEKMRGQISGLNQAASNAQDAISLVQTAEGALNETHSILQRMRELAVQSSNDTNTDVDRVEIQKEIDQLATEITRISDTTEFNTQNLLGGKFDAKFHIGANKGQNMELKISEMSANALKVAGEGGAGFAITGATTAGAGDSALFVAATEAAYTAMSYEDYVSTDGTAINFTNSANTEATTKYVLVNSDGDAVATSADAKTYTEINAVSANRGAVVFGNTVIDGQVNFDGTLANGATATATIQDSKLAGGTYKIADVSTNPQYSATWKVGLADSNGNIVALGAVGTTGIAGATAGAVTNWVSTTDHTESLLTQGVNTGFGVGTEITVSGQGIDVSTQEAADAAIKTIDDAIANVSSERSKLGATQNRLDHTINNLTTTSENLSAAESRIRDVDMAKEMMDFTKNNILSQAATSMLAQANQMPQSVLQLLQ